MEVNPRVSTRSDPGMDVGQVDVIIENLNHISRLAPQTRTAVAAKGKKAESLDSTSQSERIS